MTTYTVTAADRHGEQESRGMNTPPCDYCPESRGPTLPHGTPTVLDGYACARCRGVEDEDERDALGDAVEMARRWMGKVG